MFNYLVLQMLAPQRVKECLCLVQKSAYKQLFLQGMMVSGTMPQVLGLTKSSLEGIEMVIC